MIEKIAQFNAKMEELGLSLNTFFVVSFYLNCPITLQGEYNSVVARKLSEHGYKGIVNSTTGYIVFTEKDFIITLC